MGGSTALCTRVCGAVLVGLTEQKDRGHSVCMCVCVCVSVTYLSQYVSAQ